MGWGRLSEGGQCLTGEVLPHTFQTVLCGLWMVPESMQEAEPGQGRGVNAFLREPQSQAV